MKQRKEIVLRRAQEILSTVNVAILKKQFMLCRLNETVFVSYSPTPLIATETWAEDFSEASRLYTLLLVVLFKQAVLPLSPDFLQWFLLTMCWLSYQHHLLNFLMLLGGWRGGESIAVFWRCQLQCSFEGGQEAQLSVSSSQRDGLLCSRRIISRRLSGRASCGVRRVFYAVSDSQWGSEDKNLSRRFCQRLTGRSLGQPSVPSVWDGLSYYYEHLV